MSKLKTLVNFISFPFVVLGVFALALFAPEIFPEPDEPDFSPDGSDR